MITLVLGGARSGKSEVAERVVAAFPAPVTYVATLDIGEDADLARRIATHRARRPSTWRTVEAGRDLPDVLGALTGTVLVDSLGPFVARQLDDSVPTALLCERLVSRARDTVVVSEEVGLSVHPSSAAGRRFQDALGALNQAVSAIADEVLFVVAGRVLRLDAPPSPPRPN